MHVDWRKTTIKILVEMANPAIEKEQLMMLTTQGTMQLWIHMLANHEQFRPPIYLDLFKSLCEQRVVVNPREFSVLIYQVSLPRREGKFYHLVGSCKRVRQAFDVDNAVDFYIATILAMKHTTDGDMLCCEIKYGQLSSESSDIELALMDYRGTCEQIRKQWRQANFRPVRPPLHNVEVRVEAIEIDSCDSD